MALSRFGEDKNAFGGLRFGIRAVDQSMAKYQRVTNVPATLNPQSAYKCAVLGVQELFLCLHAALFARRDYPLRSCRWLRFGASSTVIGSPRTSNQSDSAVGFRRQNGHTLKLNSLQTFT